jgi:hypothetical protein
MSAIPADFGVAAWQRQVDVALKVAEAIVEGTEKARQIQLAAALDTHAWLEATRKSLTETPAITDVVALQPKLAAESMSKVAQYWSSIGANARDTQTRVLKLLLEGSVAAPAPASQEALTSMMDAGYKQWLDAVKQLYGATVTS